jgi:hypothetical protein
MFVLAGCDPGPGTRVMVLNASAGEFELGGERVEYWHSVPVSVAHGSVERRPLARGSVSLGTLVVTSLLQSDDPSDYEAAVNVHEDTTGVLSAREYSPYIEATIEPSQ